MHKVASCEESNSGTSNASGAISYSVILVCDTCRCQPRFAFVALQFGS